MDRMLKALLGDPETISEYSSNDTLLPCPKCGGEPHYIHLDTGEHITECSHCAHVAVVSHDYGEMVLEWNLRRNLLKLVEINYGNQRR